VSLALGQCTSPSIFASLSLTHFLKEYTSKVRKPLQRRFPVTATNPLYEGKHAATVASHKVVPYVLSMIE
jgi:hypothetical protein